MGQANLGHISARSIRRNLLGYALLALAPGAFALQAPPVPTASSNSGQQPSTALADLAKAFKTALSLVPRPSSDTKSTDKKSAVACGSLPSQLGTNLSYRTSSAPRVSRLLVDNTVCVSQTEFGPNPSRTQSKKSADDGAAITKWLPFLILISKGDCVIDSGPDSPAASHLAPCLPVVLYVRTVESTANGDEAGGRINAPAAGAGTITWRVMIYWDDQGHIHFSEWWAEKFGANATLTLNGQIITPDQASTEANPSNVIPGFPQIPGEPAPPCSSLSSSDAGSVPCQLDTGEIHVPTPVDLALYSTDSLVCQMPIHVEIYRDPDACRVYQPNEKAAKFDISFPRPTWCSPRNSPLDNGITIASPKIFDTFALRKLLATTATQLAGIIPFSQTAITNSFGTLQGVTRDVSYLAAQVTTTATPSILSTVTNPSATTTTTTPAQAGNSTSNTTTVTASCPPGFIPSIGSGNAISCAAAPSGTSSGNTTLTTQTPTGSSSVQVQGTQGTQVQTTTPSITGTVAPAPASTALAAPTTTAVGSADMLAEQMQLSSQLTMLQMLLQGANSDQLLVAQGRAIGMRAQTTLAFPITLRPPKAYKHAVAEVRVLLIPRRSGNYANAKLSIVNLLPSEKTYNVAKITSKQKAFGAGVAIEAVNVGVAGGRSRDRLYIAKDTDTVALQYPTDKLDGILAPWPAWLKPWLTNRLLGKNGSVDTQDCTAILPDEVLSSGNLNTSRYDFNAATMFGWQFRPVLGAEYVASNLRTVFAQLALPEEEGSGSAPQMDVFVQTRWRDYSESRQITGSSHGVTCQWKQLDDGVTIYNPIKIKNVEVEDTGGGILRVRAEGDLLSNNLTVRSGSSMIPPQFFDGKRIEFFANAIDLLHNGDLELVKEDGGETPLSIPWKSGKDCKLKSAEIVAIPQPDGTALVRASFARGRDYDREPVDQYKDGPESYKVLIGSSAYGLQETPFLGEPDCSATDADGSTICTYSFTAQTSALRPAQTFLGRDIAKDDFGERGTIRFEPEFDSVKAISAGGGAGSGDSQACGGTDKKTNKALPPCWYEVKGTDFLRITAAELGAACIGTCLHVYEDTSSGRYQPLALTFQGSLAGVPRTGDNLVVVDDKTLRISDSSSDKLSTLHFVWQQDPHPDGIDWPLAVKKPDDNPITADPPVLHVNDSRAVKFTGSGLSGFQSASFEGVQIPTAAQSTADKSGKSITLQIPSSVTAKPGYKEILVTVTQPATQANGAAGTGSGKATTKTIALPILVVEK